jgi:hypothetical protein
VEMYTYGLGYSFLSMHILANDSGPGTAIHTCVAEEILAVQYPARQREARHGRVTAGNVPSLAAQSA